MVSKTYKSIHTTSRTLKKKKSSSKKKSKSSTSSKLSNGTPKSVSGTEDLIHDGSESSSLKNGTHENQYTIQVNGDSHATGSTKNTRRNDLSIKINKVFSTTSGALESKSVGPLRPNTHHSLQGSLTPSLSKSIKHSLSEDRERYKSKKDGGTSKIHVAYKFRTGKKSESHYKVKCNAESITLRNKKTNISIPITNKSTFVPHNTNQEDFYNAMNMEHRYVKHALDGNWCQSIICHGPTGGGKTYTIGLEDFRGKQIKERDGLIKRFLSELYAEMQKRNIEDRCKLKVSMIDIDGQKAFDIATSGSQLKEVEVVGESGSFYCEYKSDSHSPLYSNNLNASFSSTSSSSLSVNSTSKKKQVYRKVSSFDEMLDVLGRGVKNRRVRSTQRNDQSSRTHHITTIHITNPYKKVSTIQFVDLAGTHELALSHYTKEEVQDISKINLHLTVIMRIIELLAKPQSKRFVYPFRESQLTMLLENSLRPSSKRIRTQCSLIICTDMVVSHTNENVKAIKYGCLASRVKIKVDSSTNHSRRVESSTVSTSKAMRERLALEFQEKMDTMKYEMEQDFKREMEKKNLEHKEAVNLQERYYKTQLKNQSKTHQLEMDQMKKELLDRCNRLEDALSNAVDAEVMDAITKEHDCQLKDLKQKLNQQHQESISNMQEDYEQRLHDQRADFEDQIHTFETDAAIRQKNAQQEMMDLKEELATLRESYSNKHDNQARELERMREELLEERKKNRELYETLRMARATNRFSPQHLPKTTQDTNVIVPSPTQNSSPSSPATSVGEDLVTIKYCAFDAPHPVQISIDINYDSTFTSVKSKLAKHLATREDFIAIYAHDDMKNRPSRVPIIAPLGKLRDIIKLDHTISNILYFRDYTQMFAKAEMSFSDKQLYNLFERSFSVHDSYSKSLYLPSHASPEASQLFFDALSKNHIIEHLHVIGECSDLIGEWIAHVLRENLQIKSLDLNRVSRTSISTLTDALHAGRAVRSLTISKSANFITPHQVKHLASKVFDQLTTLNLNLNDIGDVGLKHLSTFLDRHSCTIKHLDLSGNNIQDEGVVHLVDALTHNHSIETLNMSWNYVRQDGCTRFAQFFQDLTDDHPFSELNLGWNQIDDDHAQQLLHVASQHHIKVNIKDQHL